MFKTASGQLFGLGKYSKGQLGVPKTSKEHKIFSDPVSIDLCLDEHHAVADVAAGSLFTLAMVSDK